MKSRKRCSQIKQRIYLWGSLWQQQSFNLAAWRSSHLTAPAWNMSPARPRVWLTLAALHPPSSPWASDLSGGGGCSGVQGLFDCHKPLFIHSLLIWSKISGGLASLARLKIQASLIDHQDNPNPMLMPTVGLTSWYLGGCSTRLRFLQWSCQQVQRTSSWLLLRTGWERKQVLLGSCWPELHLLAQIWKHLKSELICSDCSHSQHKRAVC